jgi:hypothetical protein
MRTGWGPTALACILAVLAVGCLAVAAYLAFDWLDYGTDSTCGNFLHYKGAGGYCAHAMRNRALGVTGLVGAAAALVVGAFVLAHRRPGPATRPRPS